VRPGALLSERDGEQDELRLQSWALFGRHGQRRGRGLHDLRCWLVLRWGEEVSRKQQHPTKTHTTLTLKITRCSALTGNCNAGHYCPVGTSSPTSFPCPAGKYTPSTSNIEIGGERARFILASHNKLTLTNMTFVDADCLNTPPGQYSVPGQASYSPCPAGKYSSQNNTETSGYSMGISSAFPACTACPAGSFCPTGSIDTQNCGVGKSSNENQHACDECASGHYCASTNTVTATMLTNGGDWSNNFHQFGRCFNGTYCPPVSERSGAQRGGGCGRREYEPLLN